MPTTECRKCHKPFEVSENYTGKFPLCTECRKNHKPKNKETNFSGNRGRNTKTEYNRK